MNLETRILTNLKNSNYHLVIAVLFFVCSVAAWGQTTPPAPALPVSPPPPAPKLLGVCTKDSLMKEPYNQWFDKNYKEYVPKSEIISQLKKLDLDDYTITIFFGSWCGDSKRELPRMYNILEQIEFPKEAIQLIAVDDADSVYKQSPTHEEQNQEIYRVPTFIFYKKGKEIARFNEFPVSSLERDVLAIFSGAPYTPNYQSYPVIRKWRSEGLLSDTNVSYRGLANQIRHVVMNRGELTAAGYVMLERGEAREGLTLFRIAAFLFPEEVGCHRALAEGWLRLGEKELALASVEKAIELNKDPAQIKSILELRDKIKK